MCEIVIYDVYAIYDNLYCMNIWVANFCFNIDKGYIMRNIIGCNL